MTVSCAAAWKRAVDSHKRALHTRANRTKAFALCEEADFQHPDFKKLHAVGSFVGVYKVGMHLIVVLFEHRASLRYPIL